MKHNRQGVSLCAMEDTPEKLCDLLAEQLACVRSGDLTRFDELAARADIVVAAIAADRDRLALPAESGERARHLYEDLALALAAEQAYVRDRMKQLRQVKRALGVYGRRR